MGLFFRFLSQHTGLHNLTSHSSRRASQALYPIRNQVGYALSLSAIILLFYAGLMAHAHTALVLKLPLVNYHIWEYLKAVTFTSR